MIDIVFSIIIILSCIKGYKKGLIIALFSIIAFIIGLAAALKLSALVAGWLDVHSGLSTKLFPFLSFAIVFFIVVMLVKWGASLIEKTIKLALLGWVNRLGGIFFYAFLYSIIFSVFLFYAQKVNLISSTAIQTSKTYNFVQPLGPFVINSLGTIIPFFKDSFLQLESFFSTVGNKISH